MNSKIEKLITWALASLVIFLLFYSNMNSISSENNTNKEVREINFNMDINVDSILDAVLDSIRLDSINIQQIDTNEIEVK
tara:strand:- start:139 stop:378 length:240 start_codon:yes stop_codon:yes gene_type:complete